MSTYAIGDLQGCLEPLKRLLDSLNFDPAQDRLWFTGDLINRGPESLETLQYIRSLGAAAISVLGNHDLHLLICAMTDRGRIQPGDTLDEILYAPDREALLVWLRQQPLAVHDPDLGYTLVHAGLAPDWDLPTLMTLAGEVERELRGPSAAALLAELYGNEPAAWTPELTGIARHRTVVNFLTRVRYCHPDGRMEFRAKGPPGTQPVGCVPWYALPGRRSADLKVLFGHWSTHHLGTSDSTTYGAFALDTGCLWGGPLTALCLNDARWIDVPGLRR